MSDFVLTSDNYYSVEANKAYCSASQWKDFCGYPLRHGCEERALATINGEYKQEETKALLIGSILDALWENDDPEYILERFPQCVSSRGATKGELKAEYKQAMQLYQRTLREPVFRKYMSGEKQVVMTGVIEDLPFKIRIDSFIEGKAIVDLKTTKSLDPNETYYIPDTGQRLRFFEAFGYFYQLAIYREVVRQNTGDILPCYLAVVDKNDHPMCDVIQLVGTHIEGERTQPILDWALDEVKASCHKIAMLKSGEIQPTRCDQSDCDYCRDKHECRVISVDDFEIGDSQGAEA